MFQCVEVQPCDPMTRCQNLSPGYSCSACPTGYKGGRVQGVGIEYARRHRQVCRDIDECADGNNGGCVPNSKCFNNPVSHFLTVTFPVKNIRTNVCLYILSYMHDIAIPIKDLCSGYQELKL